MGGATWRIDVGSNVRSLQGINTENWTNWFLDWKEEVNQAFENAGFNMPETDESRRSETNESGGQSDV